MEDKNLSTDKMCNFEFQYVIKQIFSEKFWILSVFFYILFGNVEAHGYCAMYGECNYNSTTDTRHNCYYEEGVMAPVQLNTSHENYEEAMKSLKTNCGYFFYDEDGQEIGKLNNA